MTLDEIRLLIPQYLSGQLTPEELSVFEAELHDRSELRVEVEELRVLWEGLGLLPQENPSVAMRAHFYQKLNALSRGDSSPRVARFTWWRPTLALHCGAAAALFMLGIFVGRGNSGKTATGDDIAQLRTQVQSLRQTVALSLLDRQSASSRLEGVSWGNQVDRPDQELLSALLSTLNHDPNTNVRLASLDALERFGTDAEVRRGLVGAIPHQDSPLVQIALIDALVHMRDNAAATELRKLSGDGKVNAAVRQRAEWGLTKLKYE